MYYNTPIILGSKRVFFIGFCVGNGKNVWFELLFHGIIALGNGKKRMIWTLYYGIIALGLKL